MLFMSIWSNCGWQVCLDRSARNTWSFCLTLPDSRFFDKNAARKLFFSLHLCLFDFFFLTLHAIKQTTMAFTGNRANLNSMNGDIRHDGIVAAIDGRHIQVRILQSSACGGCKIAGHCSASEMKEKVIDVFADSAAYDVGQQVVVSVASTVARRALLLGFALPLLLLVGVLVCMLIAGYDEQQAGLVSLLSLLPYYGLLWLLRRRVERKVSFDIEPKN